jgi:hypothetical protein
LDHDEWWDMMLEMAIRFPDLPSVNASLGEIMDMPVGMFFRLREMLIEAMPSEG